MNVLNKAVQTLSPLRELQAGEVFFDDEHGPIIVTDEMNEGDVLCVNLVTGETIFFEPERRVFARPDAELVLP